MMTIEKTPGQTPEHHDEDKLEVIAHLFDRWALFHVDTTVLTTDEVAEDIEEAHNDLHRDED